MKKYIHLLITIILIVSLISCVNENECDNIFGCYIESWEYDAPLEYDNVYIEITKNFLFEIMNNEESFLVFYGQPECGACIRNIGYVDLNAKKLGITQIYYLEATVLSKNKDDDFINTFIALTGIDDTSAPNKLPQLWMFIEGEYRDSMRNYLNSDDKNLNRVSEVLMENYLKEIGE